MIDYACMSADELTLWHQGAADAARFTGYTVQKPCADCPLAFRLEEYAAGRCRLPRPTATSRSREYKREWMRRYRERQATAYNDECNGTEASVAILRPGPLHS